jgi:ATP-dependent DNA helicase RecQ
MGDSVRETMKLFNAGREIEEIARERKLVVGTIYDHLLQAITSGEELDINRLLSPTQQQQISHAFEKIGKSNLTGVMELLDGTVEFAQLRIYRAYLSKK